MRSSVRVIVIGISAAAVVAASLWLLPPVRALAYQVQGGKLLEQVLTAAGDPYISGIACELPPLTDGESLDQLARAIELLQKATARKPRLAQAYLLLGRADCLRGEPESAVKYFLEYARLRPDNPLGYLEAGFGFEALCKYASTTDCSDPQSRALIIKTWRTIDIYPHQFAFYANEAFEKHEYREAERWFRNNQWLGAIPLDSLDFPTIFKWSVSAVVAGQPIPDQFYTKLPVYNLSDQIQLEAEQMRWMRSLPIWNLEYGNLVDAIPMEDAVVGGLFWNGQVIAFVHVTQSGEYKFIIRALNSPPSPVIGQLTDNFQPIGKFELERGDNSFQEFQVLATLSPGMHLIGIEYLNNAVVGDQDRDALVDWVRIIKESSD